MEESLLKLYDHQKPQLKAGEYELKASLNLDLNSHDLPEDNGLHDSMKFRVEGPRFQLGEDDIHSWYPSPGDKGDFSGTLPHIVFNKRVLPWERLLTENDDDIPWMALLVFEKGELIGGADSETQIETIEVENLKKDKGIIAPNISIDMLSKAEKSMRCKTIRFSSGLFDKIVPKWDKVTRLALIREVDLQHKELLPVNEDGQFSVMFSNRLPKPPTDQKVIVHLVSLEGWNDYLAPNSNKRVQDQGAEVRMVSLNSWSFTCVQEIGFKQVMEKMAKDPQKLLHIPTTGMDPTTHRNVIERLARGYVPKHYHTQSGEDTFAWYRGPLVPNDVPLTQRTTPFLSRSGAMIYDNVYGVFDQSYAVAWEWGRKLARADETFATQLLKVRQKSHRLVDKKVAQEVQGWTSSSLWSSFTECDEEECPDIGEQINKVIINLDETSLFGKVQSTLTGQNSNPPTQESSEEERERGASKSIGGQALLHDKMQDVMGEISDEWAPISNWLGELLLLKKIPLSYLVSDWQMLPIDTIRFFRLDPNWLYAMMDGALSLGIQSSRDLELQRVIRSSLFQEAYANSAIERSQLLGQNLNRQNFNMEAVRSGFLMRSNLVDHKPGMTVKVTAKEGEVSHVIRLERPQRTFWFCLFEGIPSQINITEPQEGICFGVEGLEDMKIDVRAIEGDEQGSKVGDLTLHFIEKAEEERLIDLDRLHTDLIAQLRPNGTLTPKEFALQLFNLADQLKVII